MAEKRAANALNGRTIAFIGGGAMAGAMIGGLLNSHAVDATAITASDPHADRIKDLEKRFGVGDDERQRESREGRRHRHPVGQAADAAVCLSRSVRQAAEGCAGAVDHRRRTNRVDDAGSEASIRRALDAEYTGSGGGRYDGMDRQQRGHSRAARQAQTILRAFGKELYVADEAFLDMATAISGSGPSYVFLFMEALIDAAVHLGFSREDARTLVTQTVRGSAIYAEHSPSHPAEMRNLVTSPGGTSAHALYQLEKGGFRTLLSKAVWAAFQRSVSLSALNSAVQPFEEKDEQHE